MTRARGKLAGEGRSRSILVADDLGTDPGRESRSQGVKDSAARLARRLGTAIDLVHVEDLYLYPGAPASFRPILDRHLANQEERLKRAARRFGVETRSTFLAGNPAARIVALGARQGQHELIAVGTHGRRGLSRLFLGSVAEEVIRNSPIPVMTVPPGAQKAASRFLSGRSPLILVPTGLTSNSARAEAYALDLASRLGGRVLLFHSLHDALHPVLQTALATPSAARELTGLLARLREDARRALQARVRRMSARGVPTTCELDETLAPAGEAILRRARSERASLIVMGTHGRSLVGGAFFGRTARGVILGAAAPVVTVRSRRS